MPKARAPKDTCWSGEGAADAGLPRSLNIYELAFY